MLMTTKGGRVLNQWNYSSHASLGAGGDTGASLLIGGATAALQRRGVSLPAGDDGCRESGGVTDDSEIVGLSDGVMAGRHSLTDQARRGEIRGEEERDWGREGGERRRGSLAALSFSLGRYGRKRRRGWGQQEKHIQKYSRSACAVPDPLLVDGAFMSDQRLKCALTGSIKLESVRCCSVVSKIVCCRCESSLTPC
ncbi:uncharacterized protein V6R79_023148 [Siganus canaliculatus]